MTTPAAFTETWANPPVPDAVSLLAHPAATPGLPETWVMSGGYDQLPKADPNLVPPSLFRIYDRANPGEAILVYDTTAPPVWEVIRGDQTGTVGHLPGAAYHSLVSHAGLRALAGGVPSGNGLVIPGAAQTARSSWTDTGEHRVAQMTVPGGEAVTGSVYEAVAWGFYATTTATGAPPNSPGPAATIICGARWGTVQLADTPPGGHPFAVPGTYTGDEARWKIHTLVSITGPAAVPVAYASIAVWLQSHNAVDLTVGYPLRRYLTGENTPAAIITAADQPFYLHIAMVIGGGGGQMFLQGSKAWRAG